MIEDLVTIAKNLKIQEGAGATGTSRRTAGDRINTLCYYIRNWWDWFALAIGGVVKVDHSFGNYKVKYQRGKNLLKTSKQVQVFGMWERESGAQLIVPVANLTKMTTNYVLVNHVNNGATIVHDQHKCFADLGNPESDLVKSHGYRDYAINHSGN